MPDRIQLENRARVNGIVAANYPNDSQLEQRIIYTENNMATVAGTLATQTLTSDATAPSNGETVTIGNVTYTYVTALTEAPASNTLTSNNTNVSDGDIVTINTQSYRFKTTMVLPFDVAIGATADLSLTNLVDAITGAGTAGTNYATGTVTNTQVTATGPTSHVLTITALANGTAGNSFTLATPAATLTAGAAFTGGVNAIGYQVLIGISAAVALDNIKDAVNLGTIAGSIGTTYSHGTAANVLVTATTNTNTTQVFQATSASSGLTIATTETSAHLSFGAATLTGNVQPVIVASAMAIPGDAGGAPV